MKEEFEDKEFYNPVGVGRTWAEWSTDPKIKRLKGFLRNDLLVRTEVSMIYGPGGSGKSYLSWYIGICVASKLPLHHMSTTQGRVLVLSEEMPPSVVATRCKLMLNEASAASLQDRFVIAALSSFDFSKSAMASQKKLEKMIQEHRSELVFIDSLADVHSGEENSNQEMGVVMRNIRAVARITGSHISVIHHMGKVGDDGVDKGHRGASVMKDVCETQIEVRPIGKNGEPRSLIKFKKARHVAGRLPGSFEFATDEDTTRMINIADEEETPIPKPGLVFSTGEHQMSDAEERLILKIRDTIKTLADSYEDRQVPSTILMEMMIRLGSTERKVMQAMKKAKSMGLVVSTSGGRKVALPGA